MTLIGEMPSSCCLTVGDIWGNQNDFTSHHRHCFTALHLQTITSQRYLLVCYLFINISACFSCLIPGVTWTNEVRQAPGFMMEKITLLSPTAVTTHMEVSVEWLSRYQMVHTVPWQALSYRDHGFQRISTEIHRSDAHASRLTGSLPRGGRLCLELDKKCVISQIKLDAAPFCLCVQAAQSPGLALSICKPRIRIVLFLIIFYNVSCHGQIPADFLSRRWNGHQWSRVWRLPCAGPLQPMKKLGHFRDHWDILKQSLSHKSFQPCLCQLKLIF